VAVRWSLVYDPTGQFHAETEDFGELGVIGVSLWTTGDQRPWDIYSTAYRLAAMLEDELKKKRLLTTIS
jgi:hypothetical protein